MGAKPDVILKITLADGKEVIIKNGHNIAAPPKSRPQSIPPYDMFKSGCANNNFFDPKDQQ